MNLLNYIPDYSIWSLNNNDTVNNFKYVYGYAYTY